MEELQSIINKPKPFNPNKNCVAKEWHMWKQEFLNYLQLIETCSKLPEKQKTLFLINLMGKEAIIAKEKMVFDNPGEEEDIEILLKKFDEIFNPPLNEMKERFKFFSRFKHAKETINDYVAIIQKQATKCNFGDQENKFIIDMIICSMDKHVQQRTFLLKDVSLSDIIKIYKDSIIDNSQIQEIYSETLSNSNENNFASAKKTDAPFDFNTLNKSAKKNFEKKDVTSKTENVKKLNNFDHTLNDFLMLPKPGPLYKSQYVYNQNVAGTYCNQLENCDRCKTKHMMGQCSHSERSTVCEEFPEMTCFNCKKNPHEENCRFKTIMTLPTKNSSNTINKGSTSFNKIEICDWCETKHINGKCPHSEKCAACEKFPHSICFQCKKNPHDDSCRFKMIITLPTKNSSNTIKKGSTSFYKIENCDWCETQHIKGQCPHNGSCTKCENFPHNICFECKKNPHDNNCNLKMILTLPMKSSSDSNQNMESKQISVSHPNKQCPVFLKTDKMQAKHTCSNCGTNHPFKQCPADRKADEIKGTCSKCGTNHPFKQCPAEKKTDETTKPICWRCKTNHPYRQCPAYNNLCSHCNQMGHYQWTCKNWESYIRCSICKHLNPPNQHENRCCKCNHLNGASNKTSYLQPQSEQTIHVSNQSQRQPPQTIICATNQRNQDSKYQNQHQQHQQPQPQQTIGAINQRNQDSQYQNQHQQHQQPQPQQTIGAINQRNQDSQYQNQHQKHQQPQPQQTVGASNQRNQESQYQNRQLQYPNQYQQHQQPQQRNQEPQYQNQQHQNRQPQYQSDQKRSKRKGEDSPCCIS